MVVYIIYMLLVLFANLTPEVLPSILDTLCIKLLTLVTSATSYSYLNHLKMCELWRYYYNLL